MKLHDHKTFSFHLLWYSLSQDRNECNINRFINHFNMSKIVPDLKHLSNTLYKNHGNISKHYLECLYFLTNNNHILDRSDWGKCDQEWRDWGNGLAHFLMGLCSLCQDPKAVILHDYKTFFFDPLGYWLSQDWNECNIKRFISHYTVSKIVPVLKNLSNFLFKNHGNISSTY